MNRLALLLVVAGGVAGGWYWFGPKAAAAAHGAGGLPAASAELVVPKGDSASRPAAESVQPDPGSGQAEGSPALVAGLVRRDPQAIGAAHTLLAQGQGGAVAEAAAAELGRQVAAARDPSELLLLLGQNNGFLHSAAGRKAGFALVQQAAKEPSDRAILSLTKVLELAMRGPIRPEDTAAKEFVEMAYQALRAPLNDTLLNPGYAARARTYQVESGDSLDGIAKKFTREIGVPLDAMTLGLVNRIPNPKGLRTGTRLRIPIDPIHAVLEKGSFLMAVYLGDVIIRLYWVAHGKDGCTPETEFVVGDKKEKPDWYDHGRVVPYGHPDNVLGDYWVKFEHPFREGFGAHGTTDPASIGTMASQGCIRMRDADIKEFFQIMPRKSKVVVRASR